MAGILPTAPPAALAERALKVLTNRTKSRDLMIVGAAEVELTTGQRLARFRAVRKSDANGPQHTLYLEAGGAVVEEDRISAADREALARPAVRATAARLSTTARLRAPETAAAVTISPDVNVLELDPGETFTETITVTIPAGAKSSKVDVYFLADTTGSMGGHIDAVKTGASSIVASLKATVPDIAFGVGNYKDFPTDPFAFEHQLAPTTVDADVVTAIGAWAASGGNDWPEGQLFALDQIAQPPGGSIGWRAGAERLLVWFGDAPGHDPVCQAISGLGYDITVGSATTKLAAEKIAVLAISVDSSAGLDADPGTSAGDYSGACGATSTGGGGQASVIAAGTGGAIEAGIDPATIVATIVSLVTAAVSQINNVSLVSSGATAPFVTSITPAGGYGPLPSDREHVLTFEVVFTGRPCAEEPQVFDGTLDVVADGAVVAAKRVHITVPACVDAERWVYSVKFVCGEQREDDCRCCAPVRPGAYATEVTIHNFGLRETKVEKRIIPVVLLGAPLGREPRRAKVRARDSIVLPPDTATMDDCCRIGDLLMDGVPPAPLPLTTGILEIISPEELSVTAVYTASGPDGGPVSIEVVQVEGKRR